MKLSVLENADVIYLPIIYGHVSIQSLFSAAMLF